MTLKKLNVGQKNCFSAIPGQVSVETTLEALEEYSSSQNLASEFIHGCPTRPAENLQGCWKMMNYITLR